MLRNHTPSDFIQYLASACEGTGSDRLPPLSELSKELKVSIATLREQLEAAKTLGLVEARPRTGIRRMPYSFFPAVKQSLFYALAINQAYFQAFTDLRNHIEASYWHQAVRLLTSQDQDDLRSLVAQAWDKLRGNPIQIPHDEHRQMHLIIYKRLDNTFVLGILEAYWEAYETVGLNLYTDLHYLQQVWDYHQQMVDAICTSDYETGYRLLIEHTNLLASNPVTHPLSESQTVKE